MTCRVLTEVSTYLKAQTFISTNIVSLCGSNHAQLVPYSDLRYLLQLSNKFFVERTRETD